MATARSSSLINSTEIPKDNRTTTLHLATEQPLYTSSDDSLQPTSNEATGIGSSFISSTDASTFTLSPSAGISDSSTTVESSAGEFNSTSIDTEINTSFQNTVDRWTNLAHGIPSGGSGESGESGESGGLIAGLVILTILLVASVVVLVILLRRKKLSRQPKVGSAENGGIVKKNGTDSKGEKTSNQFGSHLENQHDSNPDYREISLNLEPNSNKTPWPITTTMDISDQSNVSNSDQSNKVRDKSKNTPDQSPERPTTRDQSPDPNSGQEEFVEHIRRLQEDLMCYQKEYEMLTNGSNKACSVARTQANISKNRYVNILPYDESRVVLPKKNEVDSDYINASYVNGAKKKKAYIASQGPTNATVNDFWLMIWDNECNRILMLTNLEESVRGMTTIKTTKCARYWPLAVGEEEQYSEVSVRLLSESVGSDWIIRTLGVRKEDCSLIRIVQQYHYTTWPDQDVPHTSTAILQFHRLSLKSSDALSASGPILVHCSAGVGRTGTLIAIDILEELWAETQPYCDVFSTVRALRKQRMSMVQSVRQYMFIYHSLVQAFFVDAAAELKPEAMEYYQMTPRHQEQFKILDFVSVTNIPHCSVAKSKPNRNRSETCLPVNSLIRFLKPVKEDDNTYINAISINGFREKNSFLVTQMPLVDTINDFWRLVYDNSCPAIVMLNSSFNQDERYWPDDNEHITKTKSFKVQRIRSGTQLTDGLLATNLEICYHGNRKKGRSEDSSTDEEEGSVDSGSRPCSRNDQVSSEAVPPFVTSGGDGQAWIPVMHLRVTSWPESETFPHDPSLLLTIYDQIVLLRTRCTKRPIIIHCMYGTDRSGVLCALVNVLDRLNEKGVVGIFDAVKLLKERRSQLMPDVEHFDYLHKLVSLYLTKRRDQDHVTQAMTPCKSEEQTTKDAKPSQPSVNQTAAPSIVRTAKPLDGKEAKDEGEMKDFGGNETSKMKDGNEMRPIGRVHNYPEDEKSNPENLNTKLDSLEPETSNYESKSMTENSSKKEEEEEEEDTGTTVSGKSECQKREGTTPVEKEREAGKLGNPEENASTIIQEEVKQGQRVSNGNDDVTSDVVQDDVMTSVEKQEDQKGAN